MQMVSVHHELEKYSSTITDWIHNQSTHYPQLLYTSVDIRESMHKVVPVDTNIFPAGFNNICQSNLPLIAMQFKQYITYMCPDAKQLLLVCEDHTRNKFYLENIFQLKSMIEAAGYSVTVCSFFHDHPSICAEFGKVAVTTSTHQSLTVHCLRHIIDYSMDEYDACLLNNDLTDGNLDLLNQVGIPILPHPNLGWHVRKKDSHFNLYNNLVHQVCSDCNLPFDPWLLSSEFCICNGVSVTQSSDRQLLAENASHLFQKIKDKYKENNIPYTPYLILKANNGTYGMGVIAIESPDDILHLNRKQRNKLTKGKASTTIEDILIQEGIPTHQVIDNQVTEEVIYHVNGQTIGGFYRIHPNRTQTDVLNATGMMFKRICQSNTQSCGALSLPCGELKSLSSASIIVSRLANLAAQKECQQL